MICLVFQGKWIRIEKVSSWSFEHTIEGVLKVIAGKGEIVLGSIRVKEVEVIISADTFVGPVEISLSNLE